MKKDLTNRLFETGIQNQQKDINGNDHIYSEAQLNEIEKILKPLLNPNELTNYKNLSDEDREQYLSGFAQNISEWQNAKIAANEQQPNLPGMKQPQMSGMEPPDDGLDHWEPVKKSKKADQNSSAKKSNQIYSDFDEMMDQLDRERKDAELDANNSDSQQSHTKDPQDIANNANDIAQSAQRMADAAQQAADAAQQAADIADKNAQESGKNSDIQNADKSQMSADAAQDLADEAQTAADRAKAAAEQAQQAANAGNMQDAAQKAKEAYEAAKDASNKARASQTNAKDSIRQSKQTTQDRESGEQGENGQSDQAGPSNKEIDNMSAEDAANAAQQSASQAQNAANKAQDAANDAQEKADEMGSAADQEAADMAQKLADKAQQMANKARQAANQAAESAENGDSASAQQSAKDARDFAQKTQKLSQQTQQKAGDQDENNNSTDPTLKRTNNRYNENDELFHDAPMDLDLPFDGNDFFGDDEETIEKCREMAERAGQPLDPDDLINPQENANKKFEKAKQALQNYQSKSNPGFGNGPKELIETIKRLFATKIDWRSQIQSFFTDKYPEDTIDVMAKRRMGLDRSHPLYQGRYLRPYEEYEDKKSGLVQIYFLVDTSGSMCFKCPDGVTVFKHIMSELIQLELAVKIRYSALSTYNAGGVYRDDVITWTYQEAQDEETLMGTFSQFEVITGGGTSALDAIKSIQDFDDLYSLSDPQTLLVVVTDGEDDYTGLKDICKESDQTEHMIWVITQTSENSFEDAKKRLVEQGVLEDHIIFVDINKEWGVEI